MAHADCTEQGMHMKETNFPKPLVAHLEIFTMLIAAATLAMAVVILIWFSLALAKRWIHYAVLIIPLGFGAFLSSSLYRGFKSIYKYSNFAIKPIPYIAMDRKTLTLLGTKIDWKNIRSVKLAVVPGRAPIRFLMIQTVGEVSEYGFPPDVLERLTRSNELVIERLSLPYNEKSKVLLTLVVGNLTRTPTAIEITAQGFLHAAQNAPE